MNFLLRIGPLFCCFAATHLWGAETGPGLHKLNPVPLFPAAIQAAQNNNIPIEGIDPPRETNSLHPGDSITGSITLFEKGGKKTQWLLYVVVAQETSEEKAHTNKPPLVYYVGAGDKVEFSRTEAPVNLRLLGPFAVGKGKPPKIKDQKERIVLNEGFLGIGLDQAAAATYRLMQNHLRGSFRVRPRPFTEAEIAEGKAATNLQVSLPEQRALVGADLALNSYAGLVMETPGIDTLFYKVVKLPSVWSLVRHLGVETSVNVERKQIAPAEPSAWQLAPQTPCYTYPLSLRINGQLAMTVTLVVAPPSPPLLECAGIVGFLAERPNDNETYMVLRIISARLH